jgi:ABC-type nitrate/sulfonate/bicarbonate transport system ATPase subunit
MSIWEQGRKTVLFVTPQIDEAVQAQPRCPQYMVRQAKRAKVRAGLSCLEREIGTREARENER